MEDLARKIVSENGDVNWGTITGLLYESTHNITPNSRNVLFQAREILEEAGVVVDGSGWGIDCTKISDDYFLKNLVLSNRGHAECFMDCLMHSNPGSYYALIKFV